VAKLQGALDAIAIICSRYVLMSTSTDIEAKSAARDPVVERAERQMRAMECLSDVGMGLARALKAQVCDGGPVVMQGDVGLLFARISRAVRQCIALEAKIGEALREWQGLGEAERVERRAAVAAKASQAEDALEVEDLDEIERASEGRRGETERRETERGERPERFWADSYVIEDEGSFVDIVTKVCRDLGVTPELSAWPEDGPGDLVVRAKDGGFWRGDVEDLTPGIWSPRHGASQRGPPSQGLKQLFDSGPS
jgi:hypothetical protein